jgi:rare lipoprotein A (peptidoglycan hydrolase)
MSIQVNLDYTGTGRVEVKIQVIANNHEEAFKTAQNILNQQKSWYRKHKEELKADQEHYKKILQFGPGYDTDGVSNLDQMKQQLKESLPNDKELINKSTALRTGVF